MAGRTVLAPARRPTPRTDALDVTKLALAWGPPAPARPAGFHFKGGHRLLPSLPAATSVSTCYTARPCVEEGGSLETPGV